VMWFNNSLYKLPLKLLPIVPRNRDPGPPALSNSWGAMPWSAGPGTWKMEDTGLFSSRQSPGNRTARVLGPSTSTVPVPPYSGGTRNHSQFVRNHLHWVYGAMVHLQYCLTICYCSRSWRSAVTLWARQDPGMT